MSADPPSTGKPSKRPRTDDVLRRCGLHDLPNDVMHTMLGLLDRDSLCSARLVSKTLCAVGSAHITSISLPSADHGADLQRFKNLSKITLDHSIEAEAFPELAPTCRAVVTDLRVQKFNQEAIRRQVHTLQKLRTLVVLDGTVKHERVLKACISLEALAIPECLPKVADAVVTMTRLTSLRIHKVVHALPSKPRQSWLKNATQLTNLQALRAMVPVDCLAAIASMTGLTRLFIEGEWTIGDEAGVPNAVPELARLTRLRSLSLPFTSEGNIGIACSLGSGRLTSLHLSVRKSASDNCWSPLTQQTALADLAVCGPQPPDLPHIRALRLGALQSIALYRLAILDGLGLEPLWGPTRLTSLEVCFLQGASPITLSEALAGLKQLRSLRLTQTQTLTQSQADEKCISGDVALNPLTSLTYLKIACGLLDDEDLRALLALRSLRELHLRGWDLTDYGMYDVGTRLTSLRLLSLIDCGVTTLRMVSQVLNSKRKDRALPPMITELQ